MKKHLYLIAGITLILFSSCSNPISEDVNISKDLEFDLTTYDLLTEEGLLSAIQDEPYMQKVLEVSQARNSLGLNLKTYSSSMSRSSGGMWGDVNEDSAVDIIDALNVAQYSVGLEVPVFNVSVADVSYDGVIDTVDALLIAQYYVGIITQFPAQVVPVYRYTQSEPIIVSPQNHEVDAFAHGSASAMADNGQYVIVWGNNSGSDTGIFAKLYNPDSNIIKVTDISGSRCLKSVAMDSEGNFVVVYSFNSETYYRVYDNTGNSVTPLLKINNEYTDPSSNIPPLVSMNKTTGDFIILIPQNSKMALYPFKKDGSLNSSQNYIADFTFGDLSYFSIEADRKGFFYILTLNDYYHQVTLHKYSFESNYMVYEKENIMDYADLTMYDNFPPILAVHDNGNFVLSYFDLNSYLNVQLYNENAEPVGNPVQIYLGEIDDNYPQGAYDLAFHSAYEIILTWEHVYSVGDMEYSYIKLRRFDIQDGSLIASDNNISNELLKSQPGSHRWRFGYETIANSQVNIDRFLVSWVDYQNKQVQYTLFQRVE